MEDGIYSSPVSPLVRGMNTDLYQITMALAYFNSGRHEQKATFELFFRKHPFGGEFTVLGGVHEAVRFARALDFTLNDVSFLKCNVPSLSHAPPAFFEFLKGINSDSIDIWAAEEGSIVMPRTPVMRVEGPIAVVQLLETQLLNIVNFASLVATNAARFRLAAGDEKKLLEFGLRRAQGPDGAFSASRYSYVGGFDSTSNVLASQLLGIPLSGTHAHSFVTSYSSLSEIPTAAIKVGTAWPARVDSEGNLFSDLSRCSPSDGSDVAENCEKSGEICGESGNPADPGTDVDIIPLVKRYISRFGKDGRTNGGELAAFISYAMSFPDGFLALIDTYDTLNSGFWNFCAVALALRDIGRKSIGIRLDSGDLAYLSREVRARFNRVGDSENARDLFDKCIIVASNDLDVPTISSLNSQGHSIDAYGVGTHLVTCKPQPALGGVFKLVEAGGKARIKLSQDIGKMTIPGRKEVYRLYGAAGKPVLDLLVRSGDPAPQVGESILCRHPFNETKRAYVVPSKVERLLEHVLVKGGPGVDIKSIHGVRDHARSQLQLFREDHLRFLNPTPYKVSVTESLYEYIRTVWAREAQIPLIK